MVYNTKSFAEEFCVHYTQTMIPFIPAYKFTPIYNFHIFETWLYACRPQTFLSRFTVFNSPETRKKPRPCWPALAVANCGVAWSHHLTHEETLFWSTDDAAEFSVVEYELRNGCARQDWCDRHELVLGNHTTMPTGISTGPPGFKTLSLCVRP